MNIGISIGIGKGGARRGHLSLNFASGIGSASLARTSAAAIIDGSGAVQSVASGTARTGHHLWDGYELANAGLLFEASGATNFCTQSDDLSAWSLTSCSFDAATHTLTSAGGGFARFSTSALATATTHTASVEVAPGSLSWVMVFIRNKANADTSAYVNLTTGALGTVTGAGVWAAPVLTDEGYWRISCAFSSGTGATVPFVQLQFATQNGSPIGPAGSTLRARRCQIEAGPIASSFIPTTGAAETRTAETMTIPAKFAAAGVWGSIKGTETYLDAGAAGQVTLFDWRADADNRITIAIDTDGTKTGTLTLTMVSGGTSWAVSADAMTAGANRRFEVAWRASSAEINIAVNGHAATAVPVTSMPDLSAAVATMGGNGTREMVRAGTGVITDEKLETYAGRPTQKDIILLIGQSNMGGRATYDSLGGHVDFVSQWNQSGALVDASVPLDHISQPAGTMGPDITFAERYRRYRPDAELIFVPCAKGSTGFSTNDWRVGDSLYNAAISRCNAAVAATGGQLKGIIWVQGEQDAIDSVPGAAYAAYLDAMIAGLRGAVGDAPFIIGQISPALSAGVFPTAAEIIAAQADTPNRVANVAVASSAGLVNLPDGVHYSAANLRTLGSRLFEALRSAS